MHPQSSPWPTPQHPKQLLQINSPAEAFLISLAVFACPPRCDNESFDIGNNI
jgi:hypothetical protein